MMTNHLIEFNKIEWVNADIGIRYKAFTNGNQRIRLAEFSEGFSEADWCSNGHIGYVLDGEFALDFNKKTEHFKKGDTIFIPSGEEDKHKAILGKGEKVTLLLFEILED